MDWSRTAACSIRAWPWWVATLLALAPSLAGAAGSAASAVSAPDSTKAEQNKPGTPARDAASVSVLELSDPSPALFQVTGSVFRRRLSLGFDAKANPGALTVEVGRLEQDDGVSVAAQVWSTRAAPTGMEPAASAASLAVATPVSPEEITIGATLPRYGEYLGTLRLTVGKGRVVLKPIKVVRSAVALPVEVGPYPQRLSSDHVEQLVFNITGPGDRALPLTANLVELSAQAASAALPGHSYDSVRLGTPASAASAPNFLLTIPQEGVGQLAVSVYGLKPGNYSGRLTLASPDYKTASVNFLLPVRSRAWHAFLTVVLGALVALFISYITSDKQPRLTIRIQIANALGQINSIRESGHFQTDESAVLDSISNEFFQCQADARAPGNVTAQWITDQTTRIAALQRKLHCFVDWVNAGRALAASGLPAAAAAPLRTRLESGRAALVTQGPMKDDAAADLDSLPGAIQAAVKDSARSTLDALIAQIQAAIDACPAPDAVANKDQALQASANYQDALKTATDARQKVDAGDATNILTGFNTASLKLLQGQGLALASQIPAPEAPAWRHVRDCLDAVVTAQTVAVARDAYAAALAAFPAAQTQALQSDVAPNGPLAGAVNAAASLINDASQLQAMRVGLADAETSLDRVDAVESADAHRLAHAARAQVEAGLASVGKLLPRTAAVATTTSPPALGVPLRLPKPTEIAKLAQPAAASWNRFQDRPQFLKMASAVSRGVIATITVLAAGVMGVLVAWQPNPVWGDLTDYAAALLWGMGLHTLGNTTVTSILNMRNPS